MEITRETPINFIVFNANIDKKTLYNGPIARMCMDSWKKAFPNLNIINIDVTEEIANMNEFSKFAYKYNINSFVTDPLRLYYINQYDNCVYCDYDVFIDVNYINDILKLMNNNNEFIINTSGTFTWNKQSNNQNYIKIFKGYNDIAKENINSKKTLCKYNDGAIIPLLTNNKFTIKSDPVTHISTFFIGIHTYRYVANKYYLYSVFIKFKRYYLILYPNNGSVRLQNRKFKNY